MDINNELKDIINNVIDEVLADYYLNNKPIDDIPDNILV